MISFFFRLGVGNSLKRLKLLYFWLISKGVVINIFLMVKFYKVLEIGSVIYVVKIFIVGLKESDWKEGWF